MVSGAFILYSIPYFTKVPPLLCQVSDGDPWASCKAEIACDKSQTYDFKPDPEAIDTLNNWVSEYDLYCTDKFNMSMIASSFFLGTFIGSFFLPRAADIYGRKPLFLVGMGLYIAMILGLLFTQSLQYIYFMLFVGGLCETGRYYIAYVYVIEMMPKE